MADLMAARRRILMDEPRAVDVYGPSPLTFFADRSSFARTAILSFACTQDGSGTPSPSNVRPIHPVDHLALTLSPTSNPQDGTSYTHTFSTLKCRGYYNLESGWCLNTERMITLDGNAGWQAVGSKFYVPLTDSKFAGSTQTSGFISNMYPFQKIQPGGSADVTTDKRFYLQRVSGYNRIWVYDTAYTLDQFKAMLNTTPLQVTYPITDEWEQEIIPVRILTGMNIATTNGTTITIRYWTH